MKKAMACLAASASVAIREPEVFKVSIRNLWNKALKVFLVLLIGILFTLVFIRSCERENVNTEIAEPEKTVVDDVVDPVESALSNEAEYIARVLYGTAQYNTVSGQKLVCWCIINRVESNLYPNTVEEVCTQEQQWMGYSDDNPVLQNLYDIAYEVLNDWHNGSYRPVGPDYIYMSWSSDEIILRTDFIETAKTHYWYE